MTRNETVKIITLIFMAYPAMDKWPQKALLDMINISFSRGKGKLTHTDRTFISPNVDPSRTKNNIVLVNKSLSDAYTEIFGEAQAAYNAKQKRKDRKISDYFCKLFGVSADDKSATEVLTNPNKQQSFYEWVIGVGTAYDTGIVDWVNFNGETVKANPQAAQIAAACLTEYINGNPDAGVPSYEERNPNFYLVKAIIHMDEKTPHLHGDVVPFADGYLKGMTRQQGIAKALDAMGYGIGETAIAQWQEAERAAFRKICEHHGFLIRDEEKSRGFTVLTRQYGEYHENELALEKQQAQITDLETALETVAADTKETKSVKNVFGKEKEVPKTAEELQNDKAIAGAKLILQREATVTKREAACMVKEHDLSAIISEARAEERQRALESQRKAVAQARAEEQSKAEQEKKRLQEECDRTVRDVQEQLIFALDRMDAFEEVADGYAYMIEDVDIPKDLQPLNCECWRRLQALKQDQLITQYKEQGFEKQ